MSGNSLLQLVKPEEYFRDKVASAASHLNMKMDDRVEYYLVNLLCEFIDPTKLSTEQDQIDVMNTPLAIMLKKALEAAPGTQIRIFKRLGDTSLYFAGFFQGFFTRKTFDIDYYISMGSTAYNQVSSLFRDRHGDDHFTEMYQNLSHEFQKLVELVATIAEEHPANKNASLITVYEQWMRTHSDRLRRILEEQGIQPVPIKFKQAQ